MARFSRIFLLLACCAAFASCQTDDAPSGDPAACSSCDGTYDRCQNTCEQTDNMMCSEECRAALQSCKKHCD